MRNEATQRKRDIFAVRLRQEKRKFSCINCENRSDVDRLSSLSKSNIDQQSNRAESQEAEGERAESEKAVSRHTKSQSQ